MFQVSADAISSYTVGNASVEAISRFSTTPGVIDYSDFEVTVRSDWKERASTGIPRLYRPV